MAHISELHYSNAYSGSSGVSEFIEIGLLPGEDPADYTVSFYQSNGQVGLEVNLTDAGVQSTTDPVTGRTYYVISEDNFDILLTDPDGGGSNNYEAYALTDVSASPDDVISFFDIGGGTSNILAVDGLAAGATSTNIPVPTGPNESTYSIQFNPSAPTDPIYAPVSPEMGPPCFLAGTSIETPNGDVLVDMLASGQSVVGYCGQNLRLARVLKRSFSVSEVRANPSMIPVRIMAGALGQGLPKRDLLVSRQHRMLVRSRIAERMFGTNEVLVPAIKLCELPGVFVDSSVTRVEYFHLLFDKHEIVVAEGAPSESLFLGQQALASVSEEARLEILEIFPKLADFPEVQQTARLVPSGRLQKQLVARHIKNNKPLLQAH